MISRLNSGSTTVELVNHPPSPFSGPHTSPVFKTVHRIYQIISFTTAYNIKTQRPRSFWDFELWIFSHCTVPNKFSFKCYSHLSLYLSPPKIQILKQTRSKFPKSWNLNEHVMDFNTYPPISICFSDVSIHHVQNNH